MCLIAQSVGLFATLWATRLLYLWDSQARIPVDNHSLLQRVFPTRIKHRSLMKQAADSLPPGTSRKPLQKTKETDGSGRKGCLAGVGGREKRTVTDAQSFKQEIRKLPEKCSPPSLPNAWGHWPSGQRSPPAEPECFWNLPSWNLAQGLCWLLCPFPDVETEASPGAQGVTNVTQMAFGVLSFVLVLFSLVGWSGGRWLWSPGLFPVSLRWSFYFSGGGEGAGIDSWEQNP